MDVFVFGASGYLGSRITRHLVDAGMVVAGASRSSESDRKIEAAGGSPVRGDIADPTPLFHAAARHDAIICAAQLTEHEEYAFVSQLLTHLGRAPISLILTTGSGMLSQRTDGDWREDSFAEDDTFVPSKYFGFRLVTETLVRSAGWSGSLRTMVIRPPMIWGHGGSGLISRFYRDAFDFGEIAYLGRGLNHYSNVHVDDLAELYRLALERGTPGALYHAVSGELNNVTVARSVAADVGVGVRSIDISEAIERWGKFETLLGMAVSNRIRCPRSRNELGWQPRHLDLMDDIGHPNYLKLKHSL